MEIRQSKDFVDAAKRAGMQHLVYISIATTDRNTGVEIFDSKGVIKKHIMISGMSFYIERPQGFMRITFQILCKWKMDNGERFDVN